MQKTTTNRIYNHNVK